MATEVEAPTDDPIDPLYAAHIEHLAASYGQAIQAAGYDALIIASGSAALQNAFDDQYWPLRRTPSFSHWLPLDEPHCALVLVPGARPQLLRAVESSFWETTRPPASNHFWPHFDLSETSDTRLADALPAALRPGSAARLAVIGGSAADWGVAPDAIDPPALVAAVHAIRTRKTAYERRCIAAANRIAARGHRAVEAAFLAADLSELALHLDYLDTTGQDDSDTPYKNIVALGEHAAVLHYVTYERTPPERRDLSLLVDAGAGVLGYASDVTRTTVRGKSFAAQQFAALVRGVETLQLEVIRRIRPGLAYEALHDTAHALLAELLRELAIGRGSAAELVSSGVTRAFLPHGLGHSLGIQVHDVGCRLRPPRADNPYLRNTSDIEVGQVFTIEPGCYFIDGLLEPLRASKHSHLVDWDAVAALRPYGGVRIEDNIAVVDGGIENLTRDNWAPAQ